MHITTSFWAKLVGKSNSEALAATVRDHGIQIDGRAGSETVEFSQVVDVRQDGGWIWSTVHLETAEQQIELGGISKRRAPAFVKDCINALFADQSAPLDDLHRQIQQLESADHYIGDRHLRPLRDRLSQPPFHLLERTDLIEQLGDSDLRETIAALQKFADPTERERRKVECNERFIEQESENELFDVVEKNKLTPEQRRAALIDEDNNLVVAAAGSGKTSVIVAKARHLLEKGLCQPEEMLLLSFTKKSANDLEERIRERLGEMGAELEVKTFHALGNKIISQVEGQASDVPEEVQDSQLMGNWFQEAIHRYLGHPELGTTIVTYFQSHFATYRDPSEIHSKTEYVKYLRSQELRTLQGDLVKSFEECEIANFLYVNNVAHVYESEYHYPTADGNHRKYKPDFFLPDYDIYIEHFAVGVDDQLPQFMTEVEQAQYRDGMRWKRSTHEENDTTLVETFSADKQEGKLLERLRSKLEALGVEFTPRDPDELFDALNETNRMDRFTELVVTFLNHTRSNRWKLSELRERAKQREDLDDDRTEAFLKIINVINTEYEQWLSDSGNIDFNEMINRATDYAEDGSFTSPFKYILVDEFQDIARSRARLLKALQANHPGSVLYCVGDDWQSIFRFTGSDVAVMRLFDQEFGATQQANLTRTFRLNSEIASISKDFILQNDSQISKDVVPHKESDHPAIHIGLTNEDQTELVEEAIQRIGELANGQNKEVLLLGRYRKLEEFKHALQGVPPNLQISFSTVHSAKGLEADYVVVLDVSRGILGFPTEMTDDPLIDLPLPDSEPYPNAEERRLFYVALTRAKEAVYLVGNATRISSFVEELIDLHPNVEIYGVDIVSSPKCPRCHTGRLQNKEGQKGEFISCSEYPCCEFAFNTSHNCPVCGSKVRVIGPNYTLRCENCEFQEPTSVCPSCRTGILVQRKGRFGWFKGCSSHPFCNNTQELRWFKDHSGDSTFG